MSAVGPFRERIPTEVMKQVAAVVPNVELEDLRLIGVTADLRSPPPDAAVYIDLKHTSETEVLEAALLIRVNYSLEAKRSDNEAGAFLKVSASFQLIYRGNNLQELGPDKLSAFADVNAVHNSWPYLRELVQSLTARMGIRPFLVPLLKVRWPQSPTEKTTASPVSKE